MTQSRTEEASVIALRKSCRADGVGLSHYILMDKERPMDKATAPEAPQVIASRQSCRADGIGLSHYILMDKERPNGREDQA